MQVKATEKGYCGRKVREKGEVFDFPGVRVDAAGVVLDESGKQVIGKDKKPKKTWFKALNAKEAAKAEEKAEDEEQEEEVAEDEEGTSEGMPEPTATPRPNARSGKKGK